MTDMRVTDVSRPAFPKETAEKEVLDTSRRGFGGVRQSKNPSFLGDAGVEIGFFGSLKTSLCAISEAGYD